MLFRRRLDPQRIGRAYYSFECFDSLPPTGNLDWSAVLAEREPDEEKK
jgi:hypothetical protein